MKLGQFNYLFDLLNDGCTAFLLVQSLLMKMKEETEKVDLKLNTQNKNHDIWSHYFMANRWRNNGNSDRLF